MALTARQQRFVAEYAVDLNATQAAIRAGYSEHTAMQQGSRLLSHVEVAAKLVEVQSKAVQRVQAKLATESAIASAAWIVEQAVKVVEIGMATVPVKDRNGKVIMSQTEDGDEEPAFYEAHNLPAVNGALNILAKRHPEFSDKHEVTGDVAVRVEALSLVSQMSPEQLQEFAARVRLG